MTIGQLKKFDPKYDNVEVEILPKVLPTDKIEIEYCYSGFLGQRVTIFVWNGKTLLGSISENKDGMLTLKVLGHNPKGPQMETFASKAWNWLYRNVPRLFENL